MYTIIKKDWPKERTGYYLGWLYASYLHTTKPLVLNKTGTNAKVEKKKAIQRILDIYTLITELGGHKNDAKKADLWLEARRHHDRKIFGSDPFQPTIPVAAAVVHFRGLLGRLRAIGNILTLVL